MDAMMPKLDLKCGNWTFYVSDLSKGARCVNVDVSIILYADDLIFAAKNG